jgi:ATP-dependent 26S proteasome regulatory subunit
VRADQERRLEKADRKLSALGRVNPLALEEFSALEARHLFLTEQLTDLTNTRRDLLSIIDEVDAIATARFDAQTGADREVQRILMELLAQMDGFDQSVNVKVIMATNRADTLDPALLRPGRLDRKIEFPLPDRRQKRLVFAACTSKMNLADEVDLEDFVSRPDKISAAEISAICQEAGLHAVRKNRYVVLPKDFEKGYKVRSMPQLQHSSRTQRETHWTPRP